MRIRAWIIVVWILASLGAMGELGRIHWKHHQAVKENNEIKLAVDAFMGEFIPRYVYLLNENAALREALKEQRGQSLIAR